MSTHADCGRDIMWARRKDDPSRFMPPLEPAGFAYVIREDETAEAVTIFRPHNCDPADVADWVARQNALAQARSELGERPLEGRDLAYEAERDRRREEAWAIALEVDCSVCLMVAGTKCISMAATHRNKGEVVEVLNPHPRRLEDAERRLRPTTVVEPNARPDEPPEPPSWLDEDAPRVLDREPGFCWADDDCMADNHKFSCPKWSS